jgi:DNA topoisomerase-1
MTISLETAVALIHQRQVQEEQRHLKSFEEEPKLEVLNGRYGPYLAYEGKNYRLPKSLHEKATELTLEQCMDIIKNTPVKKK